MAVLRSASTTNGGPSVTISLVVKRQLPCADNKALTEKVHSPAITM